MLIRYLTHSNKEQTIKKTTMENTKAIHTKWLFDKQSLCLKFFFFLLAWHFFKHILIISVDQKASVKALAQVDFLMYALRTSITPRKQEKMAKFTKLSFCQKQIFWHQTSSHKCSVCLYCVSKESDCFSKSYGTSWSPPHMHYLYIKQNALRITKGNNYRIGP